MPNRTRTHDLRVYLSDDEYRILEAKIKLANMHSRSAFIRQLIIEGIVYDVDCSYLREYKLSARQDRQQYQPDCSQSKHHRQHI